jgi:hypothetical protein
MDVSFISAVYTECLVHNVNLPFGSFISLKLYVVASLRSKEVDAE